MVATGCASSSGLRTGPAAFPRAPAIERGEVPPLANPIGEAVVETALTALGIPYRLGGERPDDGFDCSGLVRYALAAHQVAMPRTVEEQYLVGLSIEPAELQPGDLVFFSTIGPGATHVGIVLDGSGARRFVHAPSEGGVVRVEALDASYWRSRYIGARRVY